MGLLALLAIGNKAAGQTQMMNATRDQINVNGLRIPTSGTLWGVASADKGEVVGQTYLDTAWAQGNLKLYDAIQPVGGKAVDTLSGLGMRYNVHFNEVEILLNTYRDTRAVQGDRIRSFSLEKKGEQPAYFTNAKNYQADKVPTGFYEILTSGPMTLAVLHRTVIRKPNYNAALEVGEKDTKILMDDDYYAIQDGKAEKLKLSKKALLELMEKKSKQMGTFIKANDLDFKDQGNLVRLFEAYNSL